MAEFKYEIVEDIGTISDGNWAKKVRVIKYGDSTPKLDIRSWATNEDGSEKMSKGITLNKEEALELQKIFSDLDIDSLGI